MLPSFAPMESHEAGGPNSNKRKLADLEGHEEAPAATATEAPDPNPRATERRTRGQEPPSGVGGADRIGNLPDAILGDIISLLPTKDGARTQILASRWRLLWRSAPLNLDYRDLLADDGDLAGVVSRILSSHLGPGRRLCVNAYHLRGGAATIDAWLRSAALDNLQELELGYHQPLAPPPASTFRFSPTLRVATIRGCHLPDSIAQALHFPQLKQLALEYVSISERSLHSMIAGCPTLECLLIKSSFGFRCIRINSLTLRSIGVNVDKPNGEDELQFGELIIENAPCLERLIDLYLFGVQHVSVISAPKLETLGFLTDRQNLPARLAFGSTVIQGLRVDSVTTVVHTVKILAVNMYVLSLDKVVDLMRCFPCLEKLYVKKSSASGPNNLWRRKHRNHIRYLDIRLKTIVLESYRGIKSQLNFVTFFVLNARVLELMTLEVGAKDYNEEFFVEQRRKLQLDNSASRGARFHFATDRCLRDVWDIQHVRDLDLTDPFVCRC